MRISVLRGMTAAILAALAGSFSASLMLVVFAAATGPESFGLTDFLDGLAFAMTLGAPFVFVFGVAFGVPAYLIVRRFIELGIVGVLALGAVVGAAGGTLLQTGILAATPGVTLLAGVVGGCGAAIVWWLLIERGSSVTHPSVTR